MKSLLTKPSNVLPFYRSSQNSNFSVGQGRYNCRHHQRLGDAQDQISQISSPVDNFGTLTSLIKGHIRLLIFRKSSSLPAVIKAYPFIEIGKKDPAYPFIRSLPAY